MSAGDLPPEAAGRLRDGAFSSGLSVNEFAACLHMGMRPVALVQGYCVMRWSPYSTAGRYGYAPAGYSPTGYPPSSGYRSYPGAPGSNQIGAGPFFNPAYNWTPPPGALSNYRCPHYYTGGDHRVWGANYEQTWLTNTWQHGFDTAYARMVEEAEEAGAHGVVGVVDTSSLLIDRSIREFHIYGTAVALEGQPVPGRVWTSYLAGPRLAKLIESGFMPTEVVAAMASVRSWPVCVTESLMRGSYFNVGSLTYDPQEITQISDAQMQARRLARDYVKRRLGPDNLHGADLEVGVHEMGEGNVEVDCILRGTRIRRVRPADPLEPPRLTVRVNG
ncbi:MAG: heavy metal-binding domain-containing protein [Actinomycetota bacterium]|nr:heavy metal-binding domain-containing protein [Actinomycetota bacterium]